MIGTILLKDGLIDRKSNCLSYAFNISLCDYLLLIQTPYEQNGGIKGQRAKLTSKSALKIREQMVADFRVGAILPAVVLGAVDEGVNIENHFELSAKNKDFFRAYVLNNRDSLCIIDGMQRTTAMKEALELDAHLNPEIRVELWLSNSINQLIYRMLVLNTGQVPWTVRRQLEVLLQPILGYIRNNIKGINIITSDENFRRSNAGEYQADKILEAFLIFGTRTEKVNARDAVSDEYIRLDFIESSSKTELLSMFTQVFQRIIELDRVFSRVVNASNSRARFNKGLDLFTSQPAMAGCIAAFAQRILGRPKIDYERTRQLSNLNKILISFDGFIENISSYDDIKLCQFLCLDALNEYIPASTSSKVGDQERSYFKDAFTVLIDESFEVESMEVCWGV